ncbi:ATP-binding protein [Alkalihalobacterium chitinilyticum]|uniref:histidine kinase n=1 Tax=Alkalihalobacterium chitinilyticum TaxID=2980103 RepID=A0ABT5VG34_9BACI|nr:sensor histidine kinase [Alkalihalobacterium chitinilyticum]MDE5414240.1 sensor histidine kinase [Alkalihalobacterium chitinilyticum]
MENLLINILFVLLPILLFQLFYINTDLKYKNIILAIVFSISIMICMNFPITNYEGHLFDLRYIAFVLGALYGGKKVAIFLYCVILFYRFYIGGAGFYIAFIDSTLLLIILLFLLIPKYQTYSLKTKINVTMALLGLSAIISFISCHTLFGFILHAPIVLLSSFVVAQALTMGLSVYFLEYLISIDTMKKQLYHNEKLKSLSEMAASISHEVRNPLTVTRGFIQLLKSPGIDDEKKNTYLDLSLQELDRAETIISDYLTFAKPHVNVDLELLNITDEMNYVANVMQPYALMQNVSIKKEFLVKDSYILGNRKQFHQCLINLSKNAIESMQNGGKLVFKVTKENKKITLKLTDTGVGMSSEQIARLGVPFFTNKEKGTGLGTMVAFSIVKAMKGDIKVNSKMNEGTTFTISIPESVSKSKTD